MSLRSVYLPETSIENDRIRIDADEHRHLVVARAETGEPVEVFDGKGNVWTASVESINKRETVAVVTASRKVSADAVQVLLGLAMVRIAAFELALEKAVE